MSPFWRFSIPWMRDLHSSIIDWYGANDSVFICYFYQEVVVEVAFRIEMERRAPASGDNLNQSSMDTAVVEMFVARENRADFIVLE